MVNMRANGGKKTMCHGSRTNQMPWNGDIHPFIFFFSSCPHASIMNYMWPAVHRRSPWAAADHPFLAVLLPLFLLFFSLVFVSHPLGPRRPHSGETAGPGEIRWEATLTAETLGPAAEMIIFTVRRRGRHRTRDTAVFTNRDTALFLLGSESEMDLFVFYSVIIWNYSSLCSARYRNADSNLFLRFVLSSLLRGCGPGGAAHQRSHTLP